MRIFASLIVLVLANAGPSVAGETMIERKEFKQTDTYPYVFRPVCYLATSGPLPLRFAVSAPECGDRRPPKLPPAAKNTPKPEAPATPSVSAAPAPVDHAPAQVVTSASGPAPAFPPPMNAPTPKPPTVDFAQFPPELIEAFKKGLEGSEARNYLFDPIFQPALPESLPKSQATYRQK